MLSQATMGWEELARAIIQDILTKHGGVVAAFPFLSFFIVFFIVAVCWKLLSDKDKEIDRMAD